MKRNVVKWAAVCSMVFCMIGGSGMTAGAGEVMGQIHVEFERSYVGNSQECAVITGKDADGSTVWVYETDVYELAQLDQITEIGCHENAYYFCEGGVIKAIELDTGSLLWENYDFGGSVSDWLFDGDSNLYVCGYFGPDLIAVTPEGMTAMFVGTANEEFYWPYDLSWANETTIEIIYEGGGMNQELPESLFLDVSDVQYISCEPDDTEELVIDTEPALGQCIEDPESYYVVNCRESITLRTTPSVYASEICQIPLGAEVSFLGMEENGFYCVAYNGYIGYALASYLSAEYAAGYSTYWVVNCQQSITLRKVPSVDGPEICQIPLGAAVTFISRADNGFYYVEYNGWTGYALSSYLSADACYGGYYSSSVCQVVNCRQSITLRTSPSIYASEICQIPLGTCVEYLGFAGNGFYQVEYNGRIGYALASYLMFI